jgi:hypothetical protein
LQRQNAPRIITFTALECTQAASPLLHQNETKVF